MSTRGLLFTVVAALVASTVMMGEARAITVSPSGTYTANSGSNTLSLTSNGQVVTCTSSALTMTVNSGGTGSVPLGGATYSGCTNSLLGPVRIRQLLPWTLQAIYLTRYSTDIGLDMRVIVPSRGIEITNGTCVVTASGGFSLARSFPGATLPITSPTTDVWSGRDQGLRANTTTNCSAIFVVPTLALVNRGNYTLSRSMTISG